MTEEKIAVLLAVILWLWTIIRLTRWTYLAWFDYPNLWKKTRPIWYGNAPDWHQSAVYELLTKIGLPIAWLIFVIVPIVAFFQILRGN